MHTHQLITPDQIPGLLEPFVCHKLSGVDYFSRKALDLHFSLEGHIGCSEHEWHHRNDVDLREIRDGKIGIFFYFDLEWEWIDLINRIVVRQNPDRRWGTEYQVVEAMQVAA